MNIESQVVSLELAKELKENGYKQAGVWWRVTYMDEVFMPSIKLKKRLTSYKINKGKIIDSGVVKYWVVPTVAELGERLPRNCESGKTAAGRTFISCARAWCCTYTKGDWGLKDAEKIPAYANTEANARAKMWLYLKKNELLKEEVRDEQV